MFKDENVARESGRAADLLQNTLLLNGTFSGICGYFFLLFAPFLSAGMGLAGIISERTFVILGGVLATYSLMLFMVAMQSSISRFWALVAVFMDALWVLGSVLLLAFEKDDLTLLGKTLISSAATVVGGFSLLQWKALKQH